MTRKLILLVLFYVAATVTAKAEAVTVVMTTDVGAIELELYPEKAPVTVANFLQYVQGGHYDGATFYRTVRADNQAQNNIKIAVIQGGRGMDAPKVFEAIAHETTKETGIKHLTGTISMGRLAPGTANSEFFITLREEKELDYGGKRYPDGFGFAAFGKVTEGMDVVRRIHQAKTDMPPEGSALEYTSGQMIEKPIKILSAILKD